MNDPHITIGEQLREVGQLVRKSPAENAHKLREDMGNIRMKCENSDNGHLIFQSYFLKTMLNDVWKNLAIDVSYRIPFEDQELILRMVGKYLKILGDLTRNGQFEHCYTAYVEFLVEYREAIREIGGRVE